MDIYWAPGLMVPKDPDATVSDKWDFTDWLGTGETISTATATATTGITKTATSNDDTSVTVGLSGGTVGQVYRVTVEISTNLGRIEQRSVDYHVEQQ